MELMQDFMQEFMHINLRRNFAKEFMQRYDLRSARAQGCGGFKRSAHSAVPTLVAWRFGGNEGLEGLERNRDW